ncbi:MAG: signal peptidase II [Planctomycetota bacterium]
MLFVVLAVGLAVDLSLKEWAFANVAQVPIDLENGTRIPHHEPLAVLPRLLNLHLVKNDGAVFGIGSNQRVFFIVFTLGALAAAIGVFARWTTACSTVAHVALGLILAGGLGNLYDRLRFGVVRDFLHMLPGWKLPFGWQWFGGSDEVFPWVFNVADVMLLVGMAMLMLYINRTEKHRKAARAAGEDEEGEVQPESA